MELEEAIDILKNLNDGYTFKACDVCSNYNETTLRCDKEKCEELIAIDTVIAELFAMQNLLDEKNEELDRLQKENIGKDCLIETLDHNEKVKDEYIKHLEEKTRNSISKDKIRELIEELNKLLPDIDYRDIKDKQEREYYKKEYHKVVAQINVLENLLKEE